MHDKLLFSYVNSDFKIMMGPSSPCTVKFSVVICRYPPFFCMHISFSNKTMQRKIKQVKLSTTQVPI